MTNHFDKVAATWDNNPIHIKRAEAIAEKLKQIIPEKSNLSALEFGAGTGLLSVEMRDFFANITLMDSSLEMISVTIEKLADADIHHLKPIFFDLEKNNYNEKTFDVIFTQMVLHHVVDIEKIISKFYRLLKKTGMLFIADLYQEDGTFHDQEFTGHLGFNPEILSQQLIKQGFTNISFEQCFEIHKPNNPKKYPVFLMKAEKQI
jgi:ubiquinone/menaquinone biosynthesis C-methylase UbiE